MKVSRELKVSNEEFYGAIYYSLKHEIEATTGKAYPKLYQGMKYQQELLTYAKNKRKVDVCIEKLTENKEYLASFKRDEDINTVNFKIAAIDSESCLVTYEENFDSSANVRELNYSIVSFVIKPFKKRKAKKKLKNIEKYIIKNR